MGPLHSSSSQGAFTKLAAYAVQGPERLPMEATNLLVAAALHFVVHLEKPRDDPSKRVVSSIREVVDAEDRQIISNEVWRPGTDLRAVPCAPLRTETLNRLMDAGYDPDLTMPVEFSLENMSHFVDWERNGPFEVIRGEGECAV